jgi:hypothetical protein
MPDHNYFANLIWQIADLLRGPYRPPQYERVMLPMTVLRRFDCVLAPTKARVLKEHERHQGGRLNDDALDRILNMEPAIPDGSSCLFRAPVTGTRQGKIVLVQLRDTIDPDNGERYTVKRYLSEKVANGDSWRHARITLKPINPDFQPIELTDSEEGELQVVAEFVEVLGGVS